jgi:hypothetical protein
MNPFCFLISNFWIFLDFGIPIPNCRFPQVINHEANQPINTTRLSPSFALKHDASLRSRRRQQPSRLRRFKSIKPPSAVAFFFFFCFSHIPTAFLIP